jgi:hypothetical protein
MRARWCLEAVMMAYEWQQAFTRIQIEYIEMPDLKLTVAQLRRLCDLPEELCAPAVDALQRAGFLWQAPDGRFVRRALGRAGREISAADLDALLGTLTPPAGPQVTPQ